MANNRLYFVHRPTGKGVFLGKRMADGWYGAPPNLGARLQQLFDAVEFDGPVDDFCLAIEDAKGAALATDDWALEECSTADDELLEFEIPVKSPNGI